MTHRPHIGVFGAGAIGTYVGIRLSSAGYPVTLIGRDRLVAVAADFKAKNMDDETVRPGGDLVVTSDPAALADCDICLVTVKSGDTEKAAASLAPVLRKDTTVISLQNGLRNLDLLRRGGLDREALAGLVTFNVHRPAPATFVKATEGPIMIARSGGAEIARQALADAGEPVMLRDDLMAVQTTKLLLNLNNGLCALTGLAIRESIQSRDLRWCFSACMREGMRVMRKAGLPVVRIERLWPPFIARLLLLPNFLVERIAGSLMRIDASARSSTLQDLDAGKKTEIDHLNGEIVRLGQQTELATPVNRFVVDGVHELEKSSERPPPFLTPAAVRAGMARAVSNSR